MQPAQTCPQSWHTPAGGREPCRSHLGDTTLLCSQVGTPHAKEWPWMLIASTCSPRRIPACSVQPCRSQEIPHQPRVLHHAGDPPQCLVPGSKPCTEAGEEGAPRTAVASRKGGNKQSGKVRAKITAQIVTSSGAAAPSPGGHCHAEAHLPLFSMARAAQPSLAEHLQPPQANSLPWTIQGPQGSTKGIPEKAGFHLKNSFL